MKKRSTYKGIGLSLLFVFLCFSSSFGQTVITDSGSCISHTLHATVTGTIPTSSGISADDNYSGVIPIGFNFDFYGTTYNQLVIGANGVINFTSSLAGAFCPWSITSVLLGNPNMRNAVCGPWMDILISAGGQITYSTIGVAPNRKFAVTWCGTHLYSCTTQYLTSQIIIYETSNIAEVHTAHKTICAWNGGYAITGVCNAAGTQATVAPGRNYPTNWSVITPPEAWRFTPASPATTYSVASIPYAPAPYATSAIYWYDSSTGAYLGSGPYLTVTPVVGTTYTAVTLGCNDSTKTYFHVDAVSTGAGGIPHISSVTYTNPTECGKCDGTITLHGVNPHQIDTVIYSFNGVPQARYADTALLDSTITLHNLCGGVYDYVYVKVADCPSNQVMATLTTPILAITGASSTNPTVCGAFDGTITLNGLTPNKPYTGTYTADGVPRTTSGVVAPDGSIIISGLDSSVYASFAITVGFCTATWTPIVLVDPAPFPASFTPDLHMGCFGDTVFVTNTSTPPGYFSYWNYEGTAIDSLHTYHVYHDEPSYITTANITLYYNTTSYHKLNCQTSFTQSIPIDHHIVASFTQNLSDPSSPVFDTTCVEIPITFNNATSTVYPASYTWNFGDAITNTDSNTAHGFAAAGLYTTTLTATDNVLGCVSTATHTSYIVSINGISPTDTSVCLRDSMTMRPGVFDVQGIGRQTYTWTMFDGTSATNLSDNNIEYPKFFGVGTFHYMLTSILYPAVTQQTAGCSASTDHTIFSAPPVTFTGVTASPQVISFGSSIQLNAGGGTFYTWTPNNGTLDNPNISNPVATPTDSATTYWVHARNEFGCLDSTSVKVYVDFDNTVFNNNGFTPNGDGKNDMFRPAKMFKFQKLVEMRVYNRWGQLLFQSSNPEIGWDGNFNGVPQDLGTYSYELIAALPDGNQKSYKGTVTLIR